MAYLGASLKSVKEAYAKKRIAVILHTGKNKGVGITVRGFEAEDLTIPLAEIMIQQWWASGPRTKVVVGWVHSDTAKDEDDEMGPSYAKLGLVEVVRPAGTVDEVADKLNVYVQGEKEHLSIEEIIRDIFEQLLYTAVKRVDSRLRYIKPGYEVPNYWSPTFTTDSGYRAGTSMFVVWPTVSSYGPKGKKTNGAKQCPTKCTTAQVCNPESARCVNRNGVVGKRVLAARPGAPAPAPVAKKTKPIQNITRVPKSARSRKAPKDKIAKDYKNQVHVGIDGERWVSSKISTGAYRWKPYKA
jgi:hypothetical protein